VHYNLSVRIPDQEIENEEKSVLMAVNLGEGNDTTAVICGALAGAWDGYKMLPDGWKNRLANKARIEGEIGIKTKAGRQGGGR